MPVALLWMLKNCSVRAPAGTGTSRPSTRRVMTPGRRYLRDASASANPSTACPATIFVTLSAQHGVRSRSWWNCIAMDASNPTLKKHTEVFSTTSSSPSSSSLPSNEMSSKPSARKSTLPPRLWFARRPNPMPLFVGSVGYAPLPPPPTLPLRECRACRGGAAAAVGDTILDAGADVGAGF